MVANHRAGEEQPAPPREERSSLRAGLWMGTQRGFSIAFYVLLVAFTGLLLVLGAKGAEIATILGLAIGVCLLYRGGDAAQGLRHVPADHSPKSRTARRAVAAASVGAVAGACLGGYLYLTVRATSDVNVVGDLELFGGERVGDGGLVAVRIPGSPPKRHHILLVPLLANLGDTGDCVDPARLDISLVLDGQPRGAREVRSGEAVDLSLADVAHEARVVILVRQVDAHCQVNLRIDRALLHD